MNATIQWSAKGRLLSLAALGFMEWLRWYSANSQKPSAYAGYMAIVMGAGVLGFLIHQMWYRVTIDGDGLTERMWIGETKIAWREIRKVECIAQFRDGDHIVRSKSSFEYAFHIVIHGQENRIALHRWMTGIDALGEVMRREGVLERDDASVRPVHMPSRLNAILIKAVDVMSLIKVVVLVLPLTWFGGLLAVSVFTLRLTGNLFVDGTLVAMAPWLVAVAIYAWATGVRARRFGEEYARPALRAKDAIITMASALMGPALIARFDPKALADEQAMNVGFAVVGVFLCCMPVAEVRRWLRDR